MTSQRNYIIFLVFFSRMNDIEIWVKLPHHAAAISTEGAKLLLNFMQVV